MDRNSTGGAPIGPSTLLWMVSLSNHFVPVSRGGVDIESFLHSHAERFVVEGKPRTTDLRPWLGVLPLPGGRNFHPVPTVADRGRIVLSRRSWNGVHPRAYPDPTNKKNPMHFWAKCFNPNVLCQ